MHTSQQKLVLVCLLLLRFVCYLIFAIKTGSPVAQAGLKLASQLRLAFISLASCLQRTNAEVTDRYSIISTSEIKDSFFAHYNSRNMIHECKITYNQGP